MADISYIPTQEGDLYLATVMDLYSRKIIGWAMEDHLKTELPLAALTMALDQRQPPPGLLHHSDRGSQYTSDLYQSVLHGYHCQTSMSRSGKTETQERYLFEVALNTNADIYLIDGKGEEGLTQFFRNTCYASGRGNPPIVRLGDKSRTHPYNGFNGSAEAIYNRLVEITKMSKAEGGARFYARAGHYRHHSGRGSEWRMSE